ncbi:MAG TPA: hypothetical protein VMV59_00040 [Candidatus Dormibacteraeota bacterium]|nr:hypothetical protein [Candidatus Dormibacteraeota bacterium]
MAEDDMVTAAERMKIMRAQHLRELRLMVPLRSRTTVSGVSQ